MIYVTNILWVGVGGFLGSVGRYLIGLGARRWLAQAWVPAGTLTVNVVGCFALGVLTVWATREEALSESTRLFLMVGLLGGFTTFSAFGGDCYDFIRNEQVGRALLNVAANTLLGLAAVAFGFFTAKRWVG